MNKIFTSVVKSLSLAILLLLFLPVLAQQKNNSDRPNIVIIISDDHAFQAISAYGSQLMQTPNMDRLAKGGALLNRAYVTNSICGPSRAVLLTGKYSHKNGFKDNETSVFDHGQDLFVKRLQEVGYETAWIGKQHLGNKPQGFDYWEILPGQGSYFNPDFLKMDGTRAHYEGYVSDIISDLTEGWLNERDASKPFCLVVGHKATHRTWMPDTGDLDMFENVTFPLPHNFYDDYEGREAAKVQDMTIAKTMIMGYDLKMLTGVENEGTVNRMTPEQRKKYQEFYGPIEADLKQRNLQGRELVEWKYQRYMKDYLATAASLDRNVGRVLDYLDENDLTDNTVVIYLSDQGFYLGEHGWFDKRFMYEESFRTPMFVRYPGVIKPGTVSDDFIMNLDIAPTLLDVANVEIPDDVQGESFLPVLSKKSATGRDAMFYHYYENGEHSVSPHFGIRTKRYKLIRFYKRVESWELFDLTKDANEMENLYGKPGYEKITAKLKKELGKLIEQYEDTEAAQVMAQKID